MNIKSAYYAMESTVKANEEACIDNCMEKEPLFTKTRQVLTHYEEAIGVTTVIFDRSGKIVKPPEYEKQKCFCEFFFRNPSQILQGTLYPCKKLHLAALAKSRHNGKSYVYSCMADFAFWTSPVYRNKRYAGAVVVGQSLSCGRETGAKKFKRCYKDKMAARKFDKTVLDVSEKTSEEIQAMAKILELCTQKISEEGEDLNKSIRRIARWGEETKSLNVSVPEDQSEKERVLLAAFQRGDNEAGYKIISELIDGIYSGNQKNLEMKRIRAIELVVLLSRATTNTEVSLNSAIHKANNRNFQRILESETVEELLENLHFAAEQMASEIFSFKGMRHSSALRRAQSYIWKNFSRKVSLEEISKAAGLSAPYFSTIFKEEMGENFSSYINRIRVEKAAVLLKETSNTIKKIAKICGFEDQSWFSKIFKHFTGITPGKYREAGSHAGGNHAS